MKLWTKNQNQICLLTQNLLLLQYLLLFTWYVFWIIVRHSHYITYFCLFLAQSCVGAFSEWRVALCTDRKKEDNFRRLLEAGGATVLNLKPPFSKSISATHAFVELNKVEMSEDDLLTLVKSGVICVKPDFIAAHLTNSPTPNPEDYCPSEVRTMLQR